jgi:hypothetical protein
MLMVGSGKCPSEQHGRLSSATSGIAPNTTANLSTSRDGQTIEVMLMVGSGKCPSEQHGRLSSATSA